MNYLFDTNAVINLISNNGDFSKLTRNDEFSISFITQIELSVGFKTEEENSITDKFLERVKHYMIDDKIINKTISIRKTHGLKLPDAIILATAVINNEILITSDLKIISIANETEVEIYNPLE